MIKPFPVAQRRSIRHIGSDSPIPDGRIVQLICDAMRNNPSPCNMQSARAVALFNDQHTHLWNIILDALRTNLSAVQFQESEKTARQYLHGHGTVLYFEDSSILQACVGRFPECAGQLPAWAEQSNGMLQYAVWTLLEQEGLGASLQHYDLSIDAQLRDIWDLPRSWRLLAQMPFGTPLSPPEKKAHASIDALVRVFS